MKIVALLATRNEELYLSRCLDHLETQGIETCLIDNGSFDRTIQIAEKYRSRGVIHIETCPYPGYYDADRLTKIKERLAAEIQADWYIYYDVDEIKESPFPNMTLAESICEVDRRGYNAINFDEFVFIPSSKQEGYEGRDYVEEMRFYYYFFPSLAHRLNAWKNRGVHIDLHSSAGHHVQFEGIRIFPDNFILRHYIFLSYRHAIEKYCKTKFFPLSRVVDGWHQKRAIVNPDDIVLPVRNNLCKLSEKGGKIEWDMSKPHKDHLFFTKSVSFKKQNETSGLHQCTTLDEGLATHEKPTSRICWDTGRGYLETSCQDKEIQIENGLFQVTFDMSSNEPIRGFQWHPLLDEACKIKPEKIEISYGTDEPDTVRVDDIAASFARYNEGWFEFRTFTPLFFFRSTGLAKQVTIEGAIRLLRHSRIEYDYILKLRSETRRLTREAVEIIRERDENLCHKIAEKGRTLPFSRTFRLRRVLVWSWRKTKSLLAILGERRE